MFDIK